MSFGLGPAYFLDGAVARSIPVMNQKGDQVWRRFSICASIARKARRRRIRSSSVLLIQEVVNEALGELLRVTAVTFEDGAVNLPTAIRRTRCGSPRRELASLPPMTNTKFGTGRRRVCAVRDAAWRGADPDTTFTHLSILTPGHMEIDDDDSR